MAGLDGQDGAGGGEVVAVGDVGSSSEVCGDTDTLEDTGECDERLWVGGREVVCALSGGSKTGTGEGGGEEAVFGSQDLPIICPLKNMGFLPDVSGLIVGDLLHVGVEGLVEASRGEVRLSVVGETFSVELVLKVLEGQRIVENNSVDVGGTLDNWAS